MSAFAREVSKMVSSNSQPNVAASHQKARAYRATHHAEAIHIIRLSVIAFIFSRPKALVGLAPPERQ